VVLDRRLRVAPGARLFQVSGPVLLYTERADAAARRRLEAAGAEVVRIPRVEPRTVLADLASRGVQSVLVEGGASILGAFADTGAFDRLAVCCAPLLIGGEGAPGPLAGAGASRLADAPRVEGVRARRRGHDLILEGVRQGCLRDLSQKLAG
jgi:diaminohydroxyphosphoribosylaminopyrimidine deaminase / 5-amino-6-(5-phosphoribosylamino)uracil reductase